MSCSVCAGYSSHNCPVCGEEVRMVECPDCGGMGRLPYLAYDMRTGRVLPVTETTWVMLPEDKTEAESRRMHSFKYGDGGCECPTCKGMGEIPEEY